MFKSIMSMIAVRGISLVFPLLLIPLQLKLLGISQYGEYNVLFAISSIGAIFINYGFDYSVSRDIARINGIISKISYICSCAFFCKLLNFIIVSMGLLVYCYIYKQLASFYIISVFLFSQVLIPIYVFQGMKKMQYLIYNTFFLNTIFLVVIITLLFFDCHVSSSSLFLIYSLVNLLAAIQMIYYIKHKYALYLTLVSYLEIIDHYKKGSWIFLSRVMSSGLSQWSIVILSSVLSPAILGVYTLADKLVRASNSFFYAVQQATYPYFCNKEKGSKLRTIMIALVSFSVIANILIFFMKDIIILFFPVLANYYQPLMIMFVSLIPMSISGMIGVNYLLANDCNKLFAAILGIAAVFNISMLYLYVVNNSIIRAAVVMFMTEGLVATMMVIAMWHRERKYGR